MLFDKSTSALDLEVADRVIIMDKDIVQEEGTPEQILKTLQTNKRIFIKSIIIKCVRTFIEK